MTRTLRSAAVASITALAALAALLAADLTPPVQAQSEDETTGRIVARRLANGRVEFGWQTPSGARVLPQSRYFPAPAEAEIGKWLRSSPVEVGGVAIGRINARLRADGRIEFAFTPTDGERVLPPARNFPADARVGRWLRSTEITIAPPAPRYIAVSAGGYHTCGLRESGEIECWRWYDEGQTEAPAGRFTAVSAGDGHTCAIRESDSEIECWRWYDGGQTEAPAGRFTAVSAGGGHTCAIRESDSEIECWGQNDEGQTEAPAGSYTAVSAGRFHTCGLRESGAIECWGWNYYGQSNAPAGSFSAVSAGGTYTCGLRYGEIGCWGDRDGDGGDSSIQRDAPAYSGFTSISAGYAVACAIRASGRIECWGTNQFWPPLSPPPGRFSAVSVDGGYACAIDSERKEVECWQHTVRGGE